MYLPGQYFGLEGSHMAFFAKLDGLHSRKTAESWADDAEFGYRRRLPHNSSLNDVVSGISPAGGTDSK